MVGGAYDAQMVYEGDPLPPAQAATAQTRQAVHVRCLGWDNLELPLHVLSPAVVETLNQMGVPYETTAWVAAAAPSAFGSLGYSFVALPQQPDVVSTTFDVNGKPQDQERLQVTVTIFAAEPSSTTRHHVNIRRTEGEHWRFQAFYTTFRREFCRRCGFDDEQALSRCSPLRTRDTPVPCDAAPADGWLTNTVGALPPQLPSMPEDPMATGAYNFGRMQLQEIPTSPYGPLSGPGSPSTASPSSFVRRGKKGAFPSLMSAANQRVKANSTSW